MKRNKLLFLCLVFLLPSLGYSYDCRNIFHKLYIPLATYREPKTDSFPAFKSRKNIDADFLTHILKLANHASGPKKKKSRRAILIELAMEANCTVRPQSLGKRELSVIFQGKEIAIIGQKPVALEAKRVAKSILKKVTEVADESVGRVNKKVTKKDLRLSLFGGLKTPSYVKEGVLVAKIERSDSYDPEIKYPFSFGNKNSQHIEIILTPNNEILIKIFDFYTNHRGMLVLWEDVRSISRALDLKFATFWIKKYASKETAEAFPCAKIDKHYEQEFSIDLSFVDVRRLLEKTQDLFNKLRDEKYTALGIQTSNYYLDLAKQGEQVLGNRGDKARYLLEQFVRDADLSLNNNGEYSLVSHFSGKVIVRIPHEPDILRPTKVQEIALDIVAAIIEQAETIMAIRLDFFHRIKLFKTEKNSTNIAQNRFSQITLMNGTLFLEILDIDKCRTQLQSILSDTQTIAESIGLNEIRVILLNRYRAKRSKSFDISVNTNLDQFNRQLERIAG